MTVLTRHIKVYQLVMVEDGEEIRRSVFIYEVIMSTALNLICENRPGVLRDIAGVVASLGGNIEYTQQFVLGRASTGKATVYMEIDQLASGMVEKLEALPSVMEVSVHQSFDEIYGSRVIIIGRCPGRPGGRRGRQRGGSAQPPGREDQRRHDPSGGRSVP